MLETFFILLHKTTEKSRRGEMVEEIWLEERLQLICLYKLPCHYSTNLDAIIIVFRIEVELDGVERRSGVECGVDEEE